MKILKRLSAAVLALSCSVWMGSTSAAIGILPVPGDGSGAVYGIYPDATGKLRNAILLDGIPIAFAYDDFWSYSAKTLTALQGGGYLPSGTFGKYDFST